MPSHDLKRRGFTLVELLAVIAIIAILAALLIPAAGVVRRKVWQTQVTTELANLDKGLKAFADKFNGQPPDFSDVTPTNWTSTVAYRYIRKTWPKIDGDELERMQRLAEGGHLDRATTLWFWVTGMAESPTNPFTAAGGPLSSTPLSNKLHEFNADRTDSRSVTINVSGTMETYELKQYKPLKVDEPFVYFDSRTYSSTFFVDGAGGVLRPYVTFEQESSGRKYFFQNPDTYQVVCTGRDDRLAGADYVFMSTPAFPAVPEKLPWHSDPMATPPTDYFDNHLDNFANFSEGSMLGDL